VADRACGIATAIAARHGDASARERIAALQAGAADPRRTR
jgi:hypothetical protein